MSTTTSSDIQTCAACKYWQEKTGSEGECRVRAPQTISFRVDDEVRFETKFPVTQSTDWCGEFEKA
ncbi:MAG: hypothetical protein ACLFRP_00360 [Puniceicoccaceae bacterium]